MFTFRLGRNGAEELKSHRWFAGIDWSNLRAVKAPHLPPGSHKLMEVLTELKDSDHTSPQYADLIQQITANFDDFKDNGVVWGRGGTKTITRKDKDDQFIGYTYKRKKVLLCSVRVILYYYK